MDEKTRYVFRFLNSKYQSWWRKRIDTPEKKQAEIEAFGEALGAFELWQVKYGLDHIIKQRAGCLVSPPPTADQLAKVINGLVNDRGLSRSFNHGFKPLLSVKAKQSLADLKLSLGGLDAG